MASKVESYELDIVPSGSGIQEIPLGALFVLVRLKNKKPGVYFRIDTDEPALVSVDFSVFVEDEVPEDILDTHLYLGKYISADLKTNWHYYIAKANVVPDSSPIQIAPEDDAYDSD